AGTMICTGRSYSPALLAIEGANIGYAVFALAGTILMIILLIEATRSTSSTHTAVAGGTR
ncbi:hypothetical protein RSW84_25095, partial [Escherichia coli]